MFDFLTAVRRPRRRAPGRPPSWPPGWPTPRWPGATVADRTKEELFTRVLARRRRRAPRPGGGRVRRRTTWPPASAPRSGAGSTGTGAGATGWSSSRRRPTPTSGSPPSAWPPTASIATLLEVDDAGRLTGRYEGANCRGEEKIRRLRLWMADAGMERAHLWAYGNSRGDLRMLRAADTGVNVGRLGTPRPAAGLPGPRRHRAPTPRRLSPPPAAVGGRRSVAAQRYSRFRIQMRQNHPQMGGR